MDIERREAEALLGNADEAGRAVERRIPRERMPFLFWAAFLALIIPGFDLFDRTSWGWVTIAVAIAGFCFIGGYYMRRSQEVRAAERSPAWMWPALTAWTCVAGLVALILDGRISFAYTVGGILAAIPLVAWAQYLKRTA